MTHPFSRRSLFAIGTAAVGAAIVPATAAQATGPGLFGDYGSPKRRRSIGTVYVDRHGRGDYDSVAGAVAEAAPGTTVVIAAGVYRERVHVRASQTGLTLIGATDDPHDVTIVYELAAGMSDPDVPGSGPVGTSGSSVVKLDAADFTARNITFANDFLRERHPGLAGTQAVAVRVQGDRSAFYRCRFLGHQDTLYANSSNAAVPARQYYRHCHIEGDVDFIFGRGTAVFDRCEIHCLERDVDFTPKGMPFAPSTSRGFDRGYLAVDCRVTSAAGEGEYKLSRPWVPSSGPTAWPALTIRDTWIGPGIDAAAPYTNMSDDHPWQDQRYAEYGNIGPGAAMLDPERRPPQLTDEEAEEHTARAYLGDWRPGDEPDIAAPPRRSFRIVVTGDSTASTYEAAREPRAGWGQALPVFTGRRVDVDNRAWSGASSKSFADRGALDAAAAALRPGDWLLIAFGHNDQKTEDPERGTDPFTTYQRYLRTFLEAARLRRAHPVLVTSVERRRFSGGRAQESLGDYPAAMRDLARAEGVPLIDLHAMSLERWNELGEASTKDYFLWLDAGHPNYPGGVSDNTHFQARGAIDVARLVARAARDRSIFPAGTWTDVDRDVDPGELDWPASITEPA